MLNFIENKITRIVRSYHNLSGIFINLLYDLMLFDNNFN